jgi:DUF4097 and DUF4098 domain-containing protein YvlB
MPSFETPQPISVTVDLGVVRELLITASDRAETVVDVRPSDQANESDVTAAEQVRVDYADSALRITGPKVRAFDFSRKSRSVDVSVELPSGSQVSADIQAGDFRSVGRLGECRFKTGAGNARLERTGPLRLDSGAGALTVGDVAGSTEIHTGTGKIEVGAVDGAAVVKSSNGDVTIAAVAGDARVRTANGAISIDRAGANVEAKTANGGIRLGEVVRGAVTLETAVGDLEIGVAPGTAAWLEVKTGFGQMRNLLDEAARPGESDKTVEVRGRTSYGDITIRRP